MDDQELQNVYNALVEMLQGSALAWVVDEIEQQIEEGKLVERQANIVEEKESFQFPLPIQYNDTLAELQMPTEKGRKADFIAIEDYSETEKLAMLLDGIDAAIDAFNMEQAVIQLLTSSTNRVHSIAVGGTKIIPDINREHDIKTLLDLTNQLRREMNNDTDARSAR